MAKLAVMARAGLSFCVLGGILLPVVLAEACTPVVGHWHYDLKNMMSTIPLEFTDPNSHTTYTSTICTSAALTSTCATKDAVAMVKDNSCKVLGAASRAGNYQYLDDTDPKAGVKIQYSGGTQCPSSLPNMFYSVWFEIHCNSEATDTSKMLLQVQDDYVTGEECVYKYVFESSGACPKYVQGDDGGSGGVSAAAWVPIVIILVLFSYCLAGSVYKRRTYGSSGVESIPHIDAMRSAFSYCVRTCCPSWTPEQHDRYKPLMDLSDDGDLVFEKQGGVSMKGDETVIQFMRH